MWYAYYETATGRLRSQGQALNDDLPAGIARKEFAERPDNAWDEATADFTIVVAPRLTWTVVEFMQLLTLAERTSIRAQAGSNPAIADFLEMLKLATQVRSDDPIMVQGLAYLQGLGLLSADRVAAIQAGTAP